MKKEHVQIKLGLKGTCLLLFVIGLLCITLSFVNFSKPFPWWIAWGSSVANTLGTTLIASCVISLILEISNINSIFQKILGNVLNDDFPLDAYSKENLGQFKYRICTNECKQGMKKEQLIKSIYKYERNLLELANGLYYDYHKAEYVIEPKENEGILKVNAKIEYKVINKFGDENNMRFKIKTYSVSGGSPKEDYENNFILSNFEINGDKIRNPEIMIEEIPKELDSNFYDYKVKINRNLGKNKAVTVKMRYEYNMPINDKIQSYKLTLPCKNLVHKIKIKKDQGTNNEWEIKTNGFTAFYYRQKEEDSKFKIEPSGSDFVRVSYEDWIIPGGGYILFFDKK